MDSSPSKDVLVKVSMPREHGSGFITIKVDAEERIGSLKRQLLEKVRTKRVSISLPSGSMPSSPSPIPALPQSTVDEYGLTLFEEGATMTRTSSPPAASFLADDRLLKELRSQFLNVPIWKLALVMKPKKETGVTQGWLKKKSSSRRLFGAWQKRYFRLTTKQLAYWNTSEAAADPERNQPKGVFPVSAFHEAVTTAGKSTPSSTPATIPESSSSPPPPATSPRGRVARAASVLNLNLDSTRVRLGPWGSFIFILEFPTRSLELQASSKEEFQKWLNAFFGKEYLSNLVVQHDKEEAGGAQRNTNGTTTKSTAQPTAASSTAPESDPSPGLPLSGSFGAIPIDQSRIGGVGGGGRGSREHSLSARGLLRGDDTGFGSALDGDRIVTQTHHTHHDDEEREDVDSEDSMSQAWEDRVGDFEFGGFGHHNQPPPPTERRPSTSDLLVPDNGTGDGPGALGSFMPTPSVTPSTSQARQEETEQNPLETIVFAAEPEQDTNPTPHQPPLTSATLEPASSDDDDDTDTEDDDDMPPPATAPFPVGAAQPVSTVDASAYTATAVPVEDDQYDAQQSQSQPTAAAAAIPIDNDDDTPAPAYAPAPPQPAPVPVPASPSPAASVSSGMFAGGFAVGGLGAAGVGGSLMGSTSIASAALNPVSPLHSRSDSFSGLSPMGMHSRRPSIDQAGLIQPPSGAELNFSPTLQRRLSHNGIAPILPPTPTSPPPPNNDAEPELIAIPDEPAPIPSPEQIAAAEAKRAAADRAEAERKERAEAHERNLSNIRRYLEEDAAREAGLTVGAAGGESESDAVADGPAAVSSPPIVPPVPASIPVDDDDDAPPPVPPPFPGAISPVASVYAAAAPSTPVAAAPAPFPDSPLVTPTHGSVTSGELDSTIIAEQEREIHEFRQAFAQAPREQLLELATQQKEQILELQRQIRILQDAQNRQLSIKTEVNQRIVQRLLQVEQHVAILSHQLMQLAATPEDMPSTPMQSTQDGMTTPVRAGRGATNAMSASATREPRGRTRNEKQIASGGGASITPRVVGSSSRSSSASSLRHRSKSPSAALAAAAAATAAHVARLANSRPKQPGATIALEPRTPTRTHSRSSSRSTTRRPSQDATSASRAIPPAHSDSLPSLVGHLSGQTTSAASQADSWSSTFARHAHPFAASESLYAATDPDHASTNTSISTSVTTSSATPARRTKSQARTSGPRSKTPAPHGRSSEREGTDHATASTESAATATAAARRRSTSRPGSAKKKPPMR